MAESPQETELARQLFEELRDRLTSPRISVGLFDIRPTWQRCLADAVRQGGFEPKLIRFRTAFRWMMGKRALAALVDLEQIDAQELWHGLLDARRWSQLPPLYGVHTALGSAEWIFRELGLVGFVRDWRDIPHWVAQLKRRQNILQLEESASCPTKN